MRGTLRRVGAVGALSIAVALIVAAPANAASVSGAQKVVNEAKGKFEMVGSLIGKFKVTTFKAIHDSPTFKAKGTEKFNGCLDQDGNGSCAGDPSGKLFFKFTYWAQFNEDGTPILGTCAHRITGGTGSFINAAGFLMMVDTPQSKPPGFKTHYEGTINLRRGGRSASDSSAPPPHC